MLFCKEKQEKKGFLFRVLFACPKRMKDIFCFIVLLRDEKYQKSYKRAFLSLIYLFPRARVSRASHAWRVCAANSREKVGSFAALRGFSHTTRANIAYERAEQIRARIVCTPAYKGVAGVGLASALTGVTISLLQWEKVARFTATDEVLLQYIAETNPISLCSHTDAHPNLNREVRHSPTWHSSESESARGRFEPVAMVKL